MLDVGIVGCGTAGAASALFLARAGHRVTVYEAVAEPSAVGAGIMIQPTGMSVLARLGLLEGVVARGSVVERLRCVTRRGRKVIDLAYRDVDPRTFGLGLHRGVLFETLFEAVRADASITLCCGVEIADLRRDGPKTFVVEEGGAELGPHDLVVAANGARSSLRDDARLTRRQEQYPWGALWFIAEDAERAFDGELYQVVEGTHHMLGLLPSGLGPSGDTSRVSLFFSLRADRVDAWRREGLGAFKELIVSIEPRAAPVVAQIHDIEQILFARYWDIVMDRWHEDGLVFLGDAAHATSPQLGQGANLALMDAMAFADALEAHDSLDAGLRAYSTSRRHHLGYYQWATRMLTPFFQSDQAWLGWLRDAFMGVSCKMPYVRTRMIRTMCGLERGVLLADPLPIPTLPALPSGER
ncbi:MAG: FAD-dependent oxidoreductase [Sandaracinaceae bacterium]